MLANGVKATILACFGLVPKPKPQADARGYGKAYGQFYNSALPSSRAVYSPDAIANATGGVSSTTSTGDCDELRTTGFVTGPSADGLVLLKHTGTQNILEITLQPNAACTMQLFESTAPISGEFSRTANQTWSAPGKKMTGDLLLKIDSVATVHFEVRWKPC